MTLAARSCGKRRKWRGGTETTEPQRGGGIGRYGAFISPTSPQRFAPSAMPGHTCRAGTAGGGRPPRWPGSKYRLRSPSALLATDRKAGQAASAGGPLRMSRCSNMACPCVPAGVPDARSFWIRSRGIRAADGDAASFGRSGEPRWSDNLSSSADLACSWSLKRARIVPQQGHLESAVITHTRPRPFESQG